MDEIVRVYRLTRQTLHLGVWLIDSYTRQQISDPGEVNMLGCVCLFISIKYYHQKCIALDKLMGACTKISTRNKTLEMELLVLLDVGFDLSASHSCDFVDLIAEFLHVGDNIRKMSHQICDLALMEHSFIEEPRIQIASGAIFLSTQKLFPDQCNNILEKLPVPPDQCIIISQKLSTMKKCPQ
jgi:hypothetical protein